MVERLARVLCRFQMAQTGQWGPRGLDKQVEKYWQDWKPEAVMALNVMNEPTEAMLKAGEVPTVMIGDSIAPGLGASASSVWHRMIAAALQE